MRTWFDFMDAYYAPEAAPAKGAGEKDARRAPDGAWREDQAAAARIGALVEGRLAKERPEDVGPAAGWRMEQGTDKKADRAPRRGRLRAALLAAAVLACCVGGAALAQGAFPWGGVFSARFGADAQQRAADLGLPGEGLGLSATSGGVTVTLEGVLDDGEKAYIPVTLTFEDGTAPDAGLQYYAMGLGNVPLTEAEAPAGNAAALLCTAEHPGLGAGDALTVSIPYLWATRTDEAGASTVAWEQEGEWNFTFTLPQAQAPTVVDVPVGTADPETGAQIAQVRLTPMGVRVVFDGLSESTQERDAISRARIVLHLEDGTTRTMADWGEAAGRAAGGAATGGPIGRPYYEVSCEYGGFIDPAQVTAVEVNGARIAVR